VAGTLLYCCRVVGTTYLIHVVGQLLRVPGQFRGVSRMPTYEYLCKECSHRFEKWQKMTDEPLEICPVCSGTVRRVYYPTGIVFKGSGFYKTDHGASSSTNSNGHAAKDENGAAAAATPENGPSSKHKPASAGPGSKSTGTAKSEKTVAAATPN
jgi:putative FmdB family regulatory protein